MNSLAFKFRGLSAVRWPCLILIIAGLVLALDPALWLIDTWLNPAYDAAGYVVFALAASLFAWSVTSPLVANKRSVRRPAAILLLAVSAAVRLASQVLAINTIGALCLVVDVYAIGLLCRLDHRGRPLSPGWLAVAFAFSLPLERILQRSIGYLLQGFSADGACLLLSTLYTDLVCAGVRLIVNGVDVLVDLPCSGARTLLLGLLGYVVAAALCRPRPSQAAAGLALTLGAAVIANMLRISILAVGIAEPERLGGISVMEQPWHDAIGLAALLIVAGVLTLWAKRVRQPVDRHTEGAGEPSHPLPAWMPGREWGADFRSSPPWLPTAAGMVALFAALVIVSLPRTPIDVAKRAEPLDLPLAIDGHHLETTPLSDSEEAFYAQYGGWAVKGRYGPHGLLLTRTTSPLRHLHMPEECLRSLGFEVDYLGAVYQPVPTAVYRAVSPDGRRYRIDVSFLSDKGTVTTNVSTAVWLWLQGRAGAWTAVQRITPEALPSSAHARFTRGVLAALELHQPTAIDTANVAMKGLESR